MSRHKGQEARLLGHKGDHIVDQDKRSRAARARVGMACAIFCGALLAGCRSTIHIAEQVGGVDTLSIDAKQRLMTVGDRVYYNKIDKRWESKRVTCTEPSPDAIVAKAAVFAANANVSGEMAGAGGLAGGSSESAASIGYRDHVVQMLRDGYFRLCEAYMNGALSENAYKRVVRSVDAFMVVVSALQVLGANPVAPAIAITPGAVSANATTLATSISGATGVIDNQAFSNLTLAIRNAGMRDGISAENAAAAQQIITEFLSYRARVAMQVRAAIARGEIED
jgi:hypothetical protein